MRFYVLLHSIRGKRGPLASGELRLIEGRGFAVWISNLDLNCAGCGDPGMCAYGKVIWWYVLVMCV